jgi:hypothetical protein
MVKQGGVWYCPSAGNDMTDMTERKFYNDLDSRLGPGLPYTDDCGAG